MSLFNKTKCCRVCLSVCLVFLSSTIYYDAGCTKKKFGPLDGSGQSREGNKREISLVHTHT